MIRLSVESYCGESVSRFAFMKQKVYGIMVRYKKTIGIVGRDYYGQ